MCLRQMKNTGTKMQCKQFHNHNTQISKQKRENSL